MVEITKNALKNNFLLLAFDKEKYYTRKKYILNIFFHNVFTKSCVIAGSGNTARRIFSSFTMHSPIVPLPLQCITVIALSVYPLKRWHNPMYGYIVHFPSTDFKIYQFRTLEIQDGRRNETF